MDETPRDGERPADYALRVAQDKAAVAWSRRAGDGRCVVLAADTVVVSRGQILGKPRDDDDAAGMLRMLSGTVHEVLTAVVLVAESGERSEVVTTQVRFLPMDEQEIEWYIASGEPSGKAGAYAIQGRAARFIDWIQGSWSNVVGLPLATVYRLLNTGQKGYSEGVLLQP